MIELLAGAALLGLGFAVGYRLRPVVPLRISITQADTVDVEGPAESTEMVQPAMVRGNFVRRGRR